MMIMVCKDSKEEQLLHWASSCTASATNPQPLLQLLMPHWRELQSCTCPM